MVVGQNINEQQMISKNHLNKYQYIYTKHGISISLVKFERFYDDTPWEIYQIRGKPELFEDVERFKTKSDALVRIKELLK
jgi:hypothetical protein